MSLVATTLADTDREANYPWSRQTCYWPKPTCCDYMILYVVCICSSKFIVAIVFKPCVVYVIVITSDQHLKRSDPGLQYRQGHAAIRGTRITNMEQQAGSFATEFLYCIRIIWTYVLIFISELFYKQHQATVWWMLRTHAWTWSISVKVLTPSLNCKQPMVPNHLSYVRNTSRLWKRTLCIHITLITLCIHKLKIDIRKHGEPINLIKSFLFYVMRILKTCHNVDPHSPIFSPFKPSNSRSSWLLMCCKISTQRPSDFWKQL